MDNQRIMPDQYIEKAIENEHFGTAYRLIDAKILAAIYALDKEAEMYWRDKKEQMLTQYRASRWGQLLNHKP